MNEFVNPAAQNGYLIADRDNNLCVRQGPLNFVQWAQALHWHIAAYSEPLFPFFSKVL